MKLISFSVDSPFGPINRIGAQLREYVVDLNFAYAFYLKQHTDTERCQQIADAIVPADMLLLLQGGSYSMEEAKKGLNFVKSRYTNNQPMFGPDNQPLQFLMSQVTLLAPVLRPNSIRDTISFETHAKNFEKRTGKPIPELWYQQPLYYKGNTSTVCGNNSIIPWPKYTKKLDFELEFGIYIGKTGRNISAEDAASYIAGYTIFNDISARDVLQQEITMLLGPAKGKDMDMGNVMGPCLVTPDEIDPANLKMEARINGETWSSGNTSDMYWSFAQIIEHVSKSETLYPGDFIGSGTIAFGCGDELERWIEPGDNIELEVEGIGILRSQVGSPE
ncbi:MULTISPECIES: fumarylacetoacetate hydrolase family protein [Alteromonadaceae]|uniref:fumarylacetoacetate hydrolase family protein n=1 Tax=Alteromonadaceae TaxID=72275 RepID=UPI00310949BC